MNRFRRVICVILCALMLSSCARRDNEPVAATPSPTVGIETFGTVASPEATTAPETLDTASLTEPTDDLTTTAERTAPAATTAPQETTAPSEPVSAASPASAEEQSGYEIEPASGIMYANSDVNVRELPDADSDRIGHLNKGDGVSITGIVSNGWVRVEFKNGEYFVNGRYLSAEPETETVTEPPAETEPPTSPTEPETTAPTTPAPEVTTTVTTVTTPEPTEFSPPPETINEDLDILTGSNGYTALNYPVQKAVWFAYLDIDPMLNGASESAFAEAVGKAFDDVVSLGCNTVYVHVRAFGDAYYFSQYYPFTDAYGGSVGDAPPYDPLYIMINEAHSRGLSFHAWVNPMRVENKEQFGEMDGSYALKQWYDSSSTNGTFVVYDKDSGYYWLSPAYPAVRQLICNGVAEIVSRYNVDAVHIDDYFYPTTSPSFDKAAFEASGASDRASWRRSVVSTLVGEIYRTVKSCNPSVLFGVSPQGNVDNNLDHMYADVVTWCSTAGYLDYIVPQIYYGFKDKLSFDSAAERWEELVTLPYVSLVCGIAVYKVGLNSEWSGGDILSRQTAYISESDSFDGIAYYRHGSLFGSANSSDKCMKKELPALKTAISDFK